jgi:hypothetical protein
MNCDDEEEGMKAFYLFLFFLRGEAEDEEKREKKV